MSANLTMTDHDPTDGTWDSLNGHVQAHVKALVDDLTSRGVDEEEVLEAVRLAYALRKAGQL